LFKFHNLVIDFFILISTNILFNSLYDLLKSI